MNHGSDIVLSSPNAPHCVIPECAHIVIPECAHIVIPACFRRGSKAETRNKIPNTFQNLPQSASKGAGFLISKITTYSFFIVIPACFQRGSKAETLIDIPNIFRTFPNIAEPFSNTFRSKNLSYIVINTLCHSEQVNAANAVKGYPPGHPCQWQHNLHCEILEMFWKTKAVSTDMDPSLRSG